MVAVITVIAFQYKSRIPLYQLQRFLDCHPKFTQLQTHPTYHRFRRTSSSTMGWLWKNDDSDYISSSSNPRGDDNSDPCATRKVVRSQCRTEEVEPGKFIRKCEKTEQIFKDCLGRPSEIVQSNKEYTEEDVTEQMVKGSFPWILESTAQSRVPKIFDKDCSSPHKRGNQIERAPPQETLPKNSRDGDVDLSGLARDI
ncbi:hypothetical protein DH2020_039754 [Rehmannia glutinosa]|uniref:Uncharacterized protein n=1 Tax=Rehmannia glutinosa TaxID=99300 RepID=A0ABR0UWQ5_REHGL